MNLMPIYSVPLWQSEFPDFEELQEQFLEAVYKYKEEVEGVTRSNFGGYQSPPTLHSVPELAPLYEYICQMGFKACADLDFVDCDVAITSAWLNFSDTRQAMNSEHTHAHVFSGVFYLKVPEDSGKLVLRNQALNPMWDGCTLMSHKNEYTAERIMIEPEEGSIVFFPSYLPHSVTTNNHDEERISIAFNVIALPKGSMDYPGNDGDAADAS